MKKNLIIVSAIAVALGFVSCNKENEVAPKNDQGYTYVFTIGHADADETRASLASEDGKTLIAWDNNDAIGTRAGTYDGFSHVLVSGGIASFSVYSLNALAIGDHIYCYFPYSGSIQSIDNIAMSIPDSQTMGSNGFDVRAMPMVSIPYEVTTNLERSDKNSAVDVINFVNLASLIDFRIYTSNAAYGAEKIEWVQFESSAICGDFNFTGATSVDYSNPNTMAIPAVTGTTIKTTFTTQVTVGGSKDDAVHAYMVVAPGSHSGTVTVKTNVATYTYAVSAKEYKRSSLKPLSVDLNNAAEREAQTLPIYEKVTSAPTDWEGYYLIATVDGNHIATGTVADKHISSTSVTPNSDGSISCSDENSLFFHKESNEYYSIKNSSGKYISWGGSGVDIAVVNNATSNNALFSLSLSGTNALIKNVGAGSRFVRWNGSADFRMYTSSNGFDVVLYKKVESRVLTSITLSGTYPTSFYKGDSFNYDGLIVTAHYDNETQRVVTPTSVSVPDLSQIANDVPVTVTYTEGDVTKTASYTVSVIARPVYTVTLADDNTELTAELGGSVSLPSRSVEGYTFEGWSVTEISQPTTTAPELIQVGSYSPTASITLYPVFSSGENTTVWAKTALDDLEAGIYVLVSPNNYAFNGTISSGHGQKTSTAITFDAKGHSTSIPNDACIIEFIATSDGFKLYNNTLGYLYASKASSGGLAWHDTESSYWIGDDNDANPTLIYQSNSAHLRCYNDTFRTYAGNSNQGIALAKQTTIVSKTYISNPE